MNAPSFLWLLTALILTVGGAYFSSHQQCMRDARTDIEMYRRLTREFYERKRQIAEVVERAKSIEGIRVGLRNPGYTYAELKDRSAFQLAREKQALQNKMDRTGIEPLHRKYDIGGRKYLFAWKDFMKYGGVFGGRVSLDFTDDGLPAIQELTAKLFGSQTDFFGVDLDSDYAPVCSVSVLLATALGKGSVLINAPSAAIDCRRL
jgi:hypothetical protein